MTMTVHMSGLREAKELLSSPIHLTQEEMMEDREVILPIMVWF